LRHELRLTPAGLPDCSTGSSDHSVSNHQRDDRGSPGCQRICARSDRLRHSLEGSPVHADRIEFTTAPHSGTCVTDWSFSLRCSPPRITATQLRLNTPRLFAAGERTLTAPTQHHLRRTTADRPGPQQHSRWKGSGMLQTTSAERRAAGGDRPRRWESHDPPLARNSPPQPHLRGRLFFCHPRNRVTAFTRDWLRPSPPRTSIAPVQRSAEDRVRIGLH